MEDPPAPPSMTDVAASDTPAATDEASSDVASSSDAVPSTPVETASTPPPTPETESAPENPFEAVVPPTEAVAATETMNGHPQPTVPQTQTQPAPPSFSAMPTEATNQIATASTPNINPPPVPQPEAADTTTTGVVATAADVVQPPQATSPSSNSEENVGGPTFMASPPPPDAFQQTPSSLSFEETNGDQALHDVDTKAPNGDTHNGVSKEHDDEDPPSTPRTLPLGVPDPDDENDDPRVTQHSLPSPDELKVTHSHRKSSMTIGNSAICFRYPKTFFVITFVVLFAIALGLSIALTSETREERQQITFHGGDDRLDHIVEFLVVNGVSDAKAFETTTSPQYQAADWIAHDDLLMLGIPKVKPSESDVSYAFVERYTMAVLYYATTGKSWRYDLSFLSDKPTCDWFQVFAPPVGQLGVLCNRGTSRIVGFSFISNNLEGPIPNELSQLTSMTYMESIGNAITGKIPTDLQRLTGMQTMVFAFNALTGTIPTWFNKLPKLEFLYLSNNMLTGSIPDTLTQTSSISVLALDDNNLKGSINGVWNLPNLEYLYLEDNDLTGGMPTTIQPNHPLLINLDLSNNKISGPLPVDLFRLSRLEILDLHNNWFNREMPNDINADNDKLRFIALHQNKLSGLIPPTIANLHQMTHLDLSSNLFSGRIPVEMDYLTKLSFLFLGGNTFSPQKIPSWVYSMTDLRELSLKGSQLTGTISDVIGALSNLILLDLDDNKLTGPIPPDIGALSNLEFLLLNRNELSEAVPAELEDLSSLRFLLLDNNHLIGDITNVCSIDSLHTAYVDCGEIFCPDECCNCCIDGEKCHDYDQISSLDPVWEAGYERQFFDFTGDDGEIFSATDDDTIVSQGPDN